MLVIFFVIALVVMILPSHFISLALYRKLQKSGNKNAMGIRVLVFIASFCLIAFLLYFLILNNIRFER